MENRVGIASSLGDIEAGSGEFLRRQPFNQAVAQHFAKPKAPDMSRPFTRRSASVIVPRRGENFGNSGAFTGHSVDDRGCPSIGAMRKAEVTLQLAIELIGAGLI